jgi:hypothetical protein
MRLCKITSSVKGCTLIKSRAEEGDQVSQFANREMLAQEQAVVDRANEERVNDLLTNRL